MTTFKMDFPQQSIEKARSIAEKYRRRWRSRKKQANDLYNNCFVELLYGFQESIKKGNCGLYFHEIDGRCDCYTYAGVAYLIAREAGLEPTLWEASEMKDVVEGGDIDEVGAGEHSFITIRIGKNKHYLVDLNMGLRGEVTFYPRKHMMKVHDKDSHISLITYRHYSSIRKLTQNQYLREQEKRRTPEHGRKVLQATQKVKGAGDLYTFITWNERKRTFTSSLSSDVALLGPDKLERKLIYDLTTKVPENGDYDFNEGELSAYFASTHGWGSAHENAQAPFKVSMSSVNTLWELLDEIAIRKGRKTSLKGFHTLKLEKMIVESGLNTDFTIRGRSVAERAAKTVPELSEAFDDINLAVESYVRRARRHTPTYKSLLRRARYTKEQDKARTGKNPFGLVFSEQERLALLDEAYEAYTKSTEILKKGLDDSAAIRSGKASGSDFAAERMMNRVFEEQRRAVRYFETMCAMRKSSFPLSFDVAADLELFMKQVDLKKPVRQIRGDLTEEEIFRGAQFRVSRWLTSLRRDKESLLIASYKPGIRKLLNRT